jgi:ATP-binding cassette subfamily B protein
MLTWPVASLGWVSSLVQEAEASQKRINEFLKETPKIKNPTEVSTKIKGAIVFENVSFEYEDTHIKALTGISFSLEKGKTLAILGKTGSGKSTILSLISRLYDVNQGQITIDGQPITTVNLYDLRNQISVVPQDAFLFSDSIKNNIKFGNENAKYETVLGERGITLSGGQKQRVSIARALIKNAPILLLDDCLSAVDTETEEIILNNLLAYCKDKTTLIVSHRVSSAKNADEILILEEGKIIEKGTHSELLALNGYYKKLYVKQLSEKEIN